MAISDFKMSWLKGGGLVCNYAVRKSEVLRMELPSWQQSTFASVVFWICDCAIHLNIQHESTTSLCTMQILLIHLYIMIIFIIIIFTFIMWRRVMFWEWEVASWSCAVSQLSSQQASDIILRKTENFNNNNNNNNNKF